MKYKEKAKFPCGLEYFIEFEIGLFDSYKIEWNTDTIICPIHGKECKKTEA